jgi:hypothetical protein
MTRLHDRTRRAARVSFAVALCSLFAVTLALQAAGPLDGAGPSRQVGYVDRVLADAPAAYWRLNDSDGQRIINAAKTAGESDLSGQTSGSVQLRQAGPRPGYYPLFDAENYAVAFTGKSGFIRVKDPGQGSVLDFDRGDAITLEAWVMPSVLTDGQQVYIVGKGRTNNASVAKDNQNYALRLRSIDGTARVSFLFRNADNRPGSQDDFHRWNSDIGFLPDGNWHHVAATYTFGSGKSIRGYIDGREVAGTWDMGGATDKGPVVDDDELWIGSSLGGSAASTFNGLIDEVAIYRTALDPQRIAARYQANVPDPREAELAIADSIPSDAVLVQIYEGLPAADTWAFEVASPTESFSQTEFAFVDLPKKYTSSGVIADRTNPFLVRIWSKQQMTAGQYELLLRARGAARLLVDGKIVAQTNFVNRNASGHEAVPQLAQPQHAGMRALSLGIQERMATIALDEKEHVFRLDIIVGGKGLRTEIAEMCVAIGRKGEPLTLLAAAGAGPIPLTDNAWATYAERCYAQLSAMDARNRKRAATEAEKYWQTRHDVARREIAERPEPALPEVSLEMPVHNAVDHFIGARLADAGMRPAPLMDDYAFLRRVTLDTAGVIPTPAEIAAFINDGQESDRRARAIDRLLDDPRWADNWVGYWQDVLAENPGILKPELNNTGPFRWWIYESLLDNKPIDRFVTELVMMEGSAYGGGPAGFAMATQNDSPMAAKAHVLGQAFLGLNMTCARCHDAPYHPFKQEELFSLAAMLERKTIALPTTSTVPTTPGARKPLVEISLKPGDKIEPHWPFAELAPSDLADGVLRNPQDSRERLAAVITSPRNERFAKVIVNRLWQRYMGRGIVEPADDWEVATPSHPELLDYLARELMLHDYDMKHVARLIFNSHAYQRQVQRDGNDQVALAVRLFASPVRRRMTAEQLVDSLFAAAGKDLNAEQLTLDPEGRRPADTFLNLGTPRRAWELTSLSNERDRPALALPMAQSIVDALVAFGWRDARPNPITVRDETPTVLQPLTLANGIVGSRASRLSDDNAVTQLCLEDVPVEQLVERVTLLLLSRRPTTDERSMFAELLTDGYATRKVDVPQTAADQPTTTKRNAVSWSNHLSAEATKIKLELERAVREGDPPTKRLQPDWRERMEDVVWALINSPEFVFVP